MISKLKELYSKDKLTLAPIERFADDVRIQVTAPTLLKDTINIYVGKSDYKDFGNEICFKKLDELLKENPEYLL